MPRFDSLVVCDMPAAGVLSQPMTNRWASLQRMLAWKTVVVAIGLLSLIGSGQASPRDDASAQRPRTDWQPAGPAHRWRYILVHHSATPTGSVESIDRAHRDRRDANGTPWRGIGYHFVIGNGQGMRDGEIAATFRWQEQSAGAHAGVSEYNTYGIGICLIGNFEESSPTPAQSEALLALIEWLQSEYDLPVEGLVRHQDVRRTECPGRYFPWEDISRCWRALFVSQN